MNYNCTAHLLRHSGLPYLGLFQSPGDWQARGADQGDFCGLVHKNASHWVLIGRHNSRAFVVDSAQAQVSPVCGLYCAFAAHLISMSDVSTAVHLFGLVAALTREQRVVVESALADWAQKRLDELC